MNARTVLVEVDDLNGHKITVGLDAIAGTQIPVTQVDSRTHFALRVLAVESDAGSAVDQIVEQVTDAVARILDGNPHDHVREAARVMSDDGMRSKPEFRAALVQAAAHVLHAIHALDRQIEAIHALDRQIEAEAPVEVRRDDLQVLVEKLDEIGSLLTLDEIGSLLTAGQLAAMGRLSDVLEGPR